MYIHMKRNLLLVVIMKVVLIMCLLPDIVIAQTGELHRVETLDGNVLIGILVSEDDERITIRVESMGEIVIERVRIKSLTRLEDGKMKNGEYWYPNPSATRYFFAPNAIGLKKGTGYYQNAWILFNNVNFGLSDHFSIGGGIVPMFLFGVSETPVWILPKVTFPVSEDQFHLGAGAMLGGVVGADSDLVGIFYGVGTLGDRERNLTVGVGYGYAGSEISTTPVINISGLIRTGRRIYLLSENYFVPEAGSTGVVSFGMRWTAENFAVDFGLFTPLENNYGWIGLPWLGVNIPFGRD